MPQTKPKQLQVYCDLYRFHENQWYHERRAGCLSKIGTEEESLVRRIAELEEEVKGSSTRLGWQENNALMDRIKALEGINRDLGEALKKFDVGELARKDTLIAYWRGIVDDHRKEIERARSVGADMNAKVRELELQLNNQREWIEDMARLGEFIQGLKDRALHAGERYVDIAMRLIGELMIARSDRDAYRHLSDDQVREQIRLAAAGYTIVDGTGDRGTAPAEASPREIAERAAVDILFTHCRIDQLDTKQIAVAIAAGVEAYHQAQQEDSGG